MTDCKHVAINIKTDISHHFISPSFGNRKLFHNTSNSLPLWASIKNLAPGGGQGREGLLLGGGGEQGRPGGLTVDRGQMAGQLREQNR